MLQGVDHVFISLFVRQQSPDSIVLRFSIKVLVTVTIELVFFIVLSIFSLNMFNSTEYPSINTSLLHNFVIQSSMSKI